MIYNSISLRRKAGVDSPAIERQLTPTDRTDSTGASPACARVVRQQAVGSKPLQMFSASAYFVCLPNGDSRDVVRGYFLRLPVNVAPPIPAKSTFPLMLSASSIVPANVSFAPPSVSSANWNVFSFTVPLNGREPIRTDS